MERKEQELQELYREIYLQHQHIFENGNGDKMPICYQVDNLYSNNNSVRNDTLKYTIFYNKECTDYKEFIIQVDYNHNTNNYYDTDFDDDDDLDCDVDDDDDDDDNDNTYKKYKQEKNDFYKYVNTLNTF